MEKVRNPSTNVTRTLSTHSPETTVAAKKKDGKQVLHTLQGVAKGQTVHVRHAGVNARHIEIIE
jgi:hypothetical protein